MCLYVSVPFDSIADSLVAFLQVNRENRPVEITVR